MGRDRLAEDPKYRDAPARKANEDELNKKIEEWTRQRDPQEIMELLQASGIAAGVVMDAADLDRDPHLAGRGFFQQMAALDGRLSKFPGLRWRMSTPNDVHSRPAPGLGEHNRQVLGDLLGLLEAEITGLQQEGR